MRTQSRTIKIKVDSEQQSRIRNTSGPSSYFMGRFKGYGLYQWNIKFYGFESDEEQSRAVDFYFGTFEAVPSKIHGQLIHGFENINSLLGRPVKASIQGRSSGWLVIDSELTAKELKAVDKFIKDGIKSLPEFLVEERKAQAEMEAELKADEEAEAERIKAIPLVIMAAQSLLEVYLDGTLPVDKQAKLWKSLEQALIKVSHYGKE